MLQPVFPSWEIYAIRLANEGLPIAAVARSLMQPSGTVRRILERNFALGKILEIPPEDWPPTRTSKPRLPTTDTAAQPWFQRIGDDLLTLHCVRVFKLTPLQGAVFSLLLRHNEVTKEMIHSVIEHRRQQKGNKSTSEETELKMVDVVICHIRRKMKDYNEGTPPVITLWGSGYYIPNEFKLKAAKLIKSYEE